MKYVLQQAQQDPAVSVSNLMLHWSHRAEMGTRTSYPSTPVVLAFHLLLVWSLYMGMETYFFMSMYFHTLMQMVDISICMLKDGNQCSMERWGCCVGQQVVVDIFNGAQNKQPSLKFRRADYSRLLYLMHSSLEIPHWISLTRWYCTKSPSKVISGISAFFLVFKYIISATVTGNGDSFVMQSLVFSTNPRRCCFTQLNLIIWDMFTATCELSIDISLVWPSSMIFLSLS